MLSLVVETRTAEKNLYRNLVMICPFITGYLLICPKLDEYYFDHILPVIVAHFTKSVVCFCLLIIRYYIH